MCPTVAERGLLFGAVRAAALFNGHERVRKGEAED